MRHCDRLSTDRIMYDWGKIIELLEYSNTRIVFIPGLRNDCGNLPSLATLNYGGVKVGNYPLAAIICLDNLNLSVSGCTIVRSSHPHTVLPISVYQKISYSQALVNS